MAKIMKIGEGWGLHQIHTRGTKIRPNSLMAEKRIGWFAEKPNMDDLEEVTPDEILEKVKTLEVQVNATLVKMDKYIRYAMLGLLTGRSVFFDSLPGTGKTDMFVNIGDGVNGLFVYRMMTSETTQADLVGVVDPIKFKQGEWVINRTRFAHPEIVIGYMDEFPRLSEGTKAVTLDFMQRKLYADGEVQKINGKYRMVEHPLDYLLTFFGAGNKWTGRTIENAVWDRWGIRDNVPLLGTTADKKKATQMRKYGTPVIDPIIDPEEMLLMQAYTQFLAAEVEETDEEYEYNVTRINNKLISSSLNVNVRREIVWKQAAMGLALLEGAKPSMKHLVNAGMATLWVDLEGQKKVTEILLALHGASMAVEIGILAELERMEGFLATASDMSYPALMQISADVGEVVARIDEIMNDLDADTHESYVQRIQQISKETEIALATAGNVAG